MRQHRYAGDRIHVGGWEVWRNHIIHVGGWEVWRNHIHSALLDVDDAGAVITYQEYHPYGSTAWWAEKSGILVSRKRYRYTGQEKDDETELG